MTPEAKVKTKIRAYLASIPAVWYCQPIGGAYSSHGVPDIVGCVRGQMFAIEVKAPGKSRTVTPLQQRQLEAIMQAGSLAMVAESVDQVIAAFKEVGFHVD